MPVLDGVLNCRQKCCLSPFPFCSIEVFFQQISQELVTAMGHIYYSTEVLFHEIFREMMTDV